LSGSGDHRAPWHAADFVPDFGATTLGDELGRLDSLIQMPELTVWTEDGPDQLHVSARWLRTTDVVFSLIVEEVVGMRAIAPNADLRWHHVGYWAESLPADIAALEAVGFRKEVWGQDEAGEPLMFAYMVAANGLRVELVQGGDASLTDWASADRKAAVAADLEAGVAPARAEGRPFAHVAGVVEDPEEVALSLERGLGVDWGEPREVVALVVDGDGEERTVSYREIESLGAPRVRLASGPLTDSLGSDERGWDHVAFWSARPEEEAAQLERHGYVRRASADRAAGATESFVLLSAPEGTRVKLVAAPHAV
jgi:hypothetical protein